MSTNKKNSLPQHFESAEQAGAFWDTHSAADYWDETEEARMEFVLQERVFMVPVGSQLYFRIKQHAQAEQRSVEELISTLLEHELA